ncbi:unnamed protein product [Caenorhabditis auriculariae]|uniref:Uncharacterized protein n=1 Tax=Caenorhabditis auriculariae TaxID=2777116 RepID=A0A8S1GSU0_9PELO|nr:unnamed protein product [Caenorhabditis auriculariae]
MKLRIGKSDIIISLVAAFLLIAGIVTWSTFSTIYNSQFKKNLMFKQKSDRSLGYSAYMMSHPQSRNLMRFYFFNISNPDEIQYEGKAPQIVETGAFAVLESEQKKYMKWNDRKTEMFYENYKSYLISPEDSCDDCDWEQNLVFPNPTSLGATTSMLDPKYKITKTGKILISLGLLLLGEYPFVSHKVREVMFDGYEDALLSAAHSDLIYTISGILKGNESIIPIPIPAMPRFGYFQGYNNSKDESYWIKTGTDDINRLGEVQTWAGLRELPAEWWSTPFSRSIRGSDSGSFSQMRLKEDSTIDFFMSFMCRSFTKKYLGSTSVDSIPALSFSVPYEDYDTTSDLNRGFRYENIEKRNYFPDWPNCPPKGDCHQSSSINCTLPEYFCHACCNGSLVDGTYLLPPGMFPLVCYPGRLQPTPFAVLYSPPHYLYSPPEVFKTVVGLHPDPSKHLPMIYNHEPYSGSVLEVFNRLQVNMPVLKSDEVEMSMNMPDVVIPLFWQDTHTRLDDFLYNTVWTGVVLVPKLVTTLQFVAIGLGLLMILGLGFFRLRKWRATARPLQS